MRIYVNTEATTGTLKQKDKKVFEYDPINLKDNTDKCD